MKRSDLQIKLTESEKETPERYAVNWEVIQLHGAGHCDNLPDAEEDAETFIQQLLEPELDPRSPVAQNIEKYVDDYLSNVKVKHPYKIGANYLIRTVTMMDTGRLVEVSDQELVIEDAAWIADTGLRFADALTKCEFGEVEPFPKGRVIIGRSAIIDMVEIATIPRSQK
jgi:hypothetical protein